MFEEAQLSATYIVCEIYCRVFVWLATQISWTAETKDEKITYLVVTCGHTGYLKYAVSKALAFSPMIAASVLPARL